MQKQLQIEKLVYGGDGLARLAADEAGRRLTAFVPGTMPGETVEAHIGRTKSGFVRADLVRIIAPSPERVAPPCRHFSTCGGCQWQHMSYGAQLAVKGEILRETFARAGVGDLPEIATLAGEPWRYRNRVRLHVDRNGRRVGYLAARSHRVIAVDECPIASPLIESAMQALNANSAWMAAVEEIELLAAPDDSSLVLAAYAHSSWKASAWFASLQNALPQLRGLALFSADGAKLLEVAGCPDLNIGKLKASAGVFFQANRFLLLQLLNAVTSLVPPDASEVWDLYAGVGLFASALERRGHRVTAVEGSSLSFADLEQNVGSAVRRGVAEFLAAQQSAPDCIVVDPPRAGLGADVCAQLQRLRAKTVVFLACDPVTMARDIATLAAGGYHLQSLTLVDLFPQSFHIETLALLTHG